MEGMHEEKQNEAEKYQGVGGPAKQVFIENPLLKKVVKKKRLNSLKQSGTEKGAESAFEGFGQSASIGFFFSGQFQSLGEPAGETNKQSNKTDNTSQTKQYIDIHN
jgi:hypothetical protein